MITIIVTHAQGSLIEKSVQVWRQGSNRDKGVLLGSFPLINILEEVVIQINPAE